MVNKKNIRLLSVVTLVFFLVFAGMALLSYFNAKKTAVALIEPSKEYVKLSRVRFLIITIEGKKRPDWIFEFRNPAVMDLDFDVYVSVFGKVVITNPTDLEKRLRRMEKLHIHPFPKVHRE